MQKIVSLMWIISALLLGCNGEKKNKDGGETKTVSYDYRKLPKRIVINEKASSILDDWDAFANFSRSVEILYQARNDEDLKLAVDDLIEKEKALAESEYPEIFDKLQLKSRQRVIKTFLLKTQADLLGNRDATDSAVRMIDAYNAFRSQFNMITNNPLDVKTILDEN
ncbi:hypothetical protein [Allomuricauda sp. d1]|uniref:hypothetical protein n=1 Tax=Allomuricauda sp. d1 TaxID=3136725 RepID=UPI0031E424C9